MKRQIIHLSPLQRLLILSCEDAPPHKSDWPLYVLCALIGVGFMVIFALAYKVMEWMVW
jgi:hypothetical protein